MVNLNRANAPKIESFSKMPEGNYLVEVKACEFRTAKSGAPYFSVQLLALEHGDGKKTLCFDTMMLGGKGHGIGLAKLDCLGFGGRDDIEPGELVGKRAVVSVAMEEYNGKRRLEVDIRAEDSKCGYWPDDDGAPKTILGVPLTGLPTPPEIIKPKEDPDASGDWLNDEPDF